MPPREAPEPVCPQCGAAFFIGHEGGLIEAMHRFDCPILIAEDNTKMSDYDRAVHSGRRRFRRPPTAAEVALLAARGYSDAGITHVFYPWPRLLRRRSWPSLTPTRKAQQSP